MLFKGWMANTTGENMGQVLEKYNAGEIVCTPATQEQEFPEATWESYCDTDEDMADIMAIILWYNDRSDADIATIKEEVRKLLIKFPRQSR